MKQIDKITIILTVFILIFTGVLFFGAVYSGEGGSEAAGETSYASYFNPEKITTVSLTISDEDWQDMLTNPLAEEYHVCSIEINGDVYEAAAIRTKGMTSLSQVASSNSDRYSFKIKSDEYVKDQTFNGLGKFVLNNNYQDATYMKEFLSYQMMTELDVPTPLFAYAAVYINGEYYGLYLMVEAVEEEFAERNFGADFGNLYKPESRNGGGFGGNEDRAGNDKVPLGVGNRNNFQRDFPAGENDFMMQQFEGGNRFADNPMMQANAAGMPSFVGEGEEFSRGAEKGFGVNQSMNMPREFSGQGGGSDLVYTDESLSSYSNIFDNAVFSRTDTPASKVRVVTALKHLKDGTDLETYIDVDEVLRYFAANTALVNLDSYAGSMKHNYYLYEEGGKLSMIPWDYNLAFGGFQSSASDMVNFPIDTPVSSGIDLSERPMIGSLITVDAYKEQYHSYLKWIAEEFFGDSFEKRVDSVATLINEYVKNDPTAFYSYEEYQQSLSELKKLGKFRAESISGQLNGVIPSTHDGQKMDSSSLTPVDGLNFSALGSMMGGGGFGGNPERKMPQMM